MDTDHFGDQENYIRDTGSSFQWLQNTRAWLLIEGFRDDRYFRIKPTVHPNTGIPIEADIDVSRVKYSRPRGAMLLPINASELGDSVGTHWQPDLFSKVYYAWVPGSNIVTQGFLSYSKVQIGVGTYRGLLNNRLGIFAPVCENKEDENFCPSFGDSGSGLFNSSGQLIGAFHGHDYVTNPWYIMRFGPEWVPNYAAVEYIEYQ